MNIGIICPALIEYKTCRDILGLYLEEVIQGRRISSTRMDELSIMAIHSGPGKIQCASATQLLIDTFSPLIIIDSGGAGSLNKQAGVFDIVCAERAYEYDICDKEDFSRLKQDLMTCTLLYKSSAERKAILSRLKEFIEKERPIQLIFGDIASGEKNVNKKNLKLKLRAIYHAEACNWETSAVLKTAELNGIDALSFRVITDSAEEDMDDELRDNWEKALIILYEVMEKFFLDGWFMRLVRT